VEIRGARDAAAHHERDAGLGRPKGGGRRPELMKKDDDRCGETATARLIGGAPARFLAPRGRGR
jgi:hypothetical protein